MAQADLMAYDDDFDEEESNAGVKNKYAVQVQKKKSSAKGSEPKKGELDFEEISQIAQEEEDDDDIDLLAKFVEG
jgi:hypothetical protein